MQLTQVFVFATTVVASVNALATPAHGVRMYKHSAIAKARTPEPDVSHVSKRGMKKRCKPRTNTSKLILPSGVGNVGNAPETSSAVEVSSTPAPSNSSEASTSKAAPSTSQAPSSTPAPTPSPSPEPAPSSSSKVSTSKAAPSTSQAPSSTPAPAPSSPPKPAPSSSTKASISKAAPSTSQAPAPTTSQASAPAPTTSKATTSKKPTSTSQAPQPTQGSDSSNNSGLGQYSGTMTGQGTWYDTGLTACGVTNNDGEHIAAVSHLLFDTFPGYNGVNPNNNPICGRKASVTYQGKTTTVTITDRCEACKIYDLDFTPTAFQDLASLGAGRIDGVSWKFI